MKKCPIKDNQKEKDFANISINSNAITKNAIESNSDSISDNESNVIDNRAAIVSREQKLQIMLQMLLKTLTVS